MIAMIVSDSTQIDANSSNRSEMSLSSAYPGQPAWDGHRTMGYHQPVRNGTVMIASEKATKV